MLSTQKENEIKQLNADFTFKENQLKGQLDAKQNDIY